MKKIPRLIFVAFFILQSNFLFSQQAPKIPKLPPMPKMPSNLPAMPKMPQMPCNFTQDPRTLTFDQQFGRFGKVKSWTGDVSIERTYKKEFDGYSSEEIHASAHGGFKITNYDTDAVKSGMSNIWPWYTSIQQSQMNNPLLNQDWIASASYNSTSKEGDEVTNCSGGGSVKGTVNLQIQYGGTCYTLFVLTEAFKIKCKSKNSEEEREVTIGGSNSFTAIPAKGDTLTGDTLVIDDGTDKTRITWKLYPFSENPKVEVIPLNPDQGHCACSKSIKDTIIKFTAELHPFLKEGEFDKFEVRMGSKPAIIVQNTGGKVPLLILKGNGKITDKVNIVAIYKKKGEFIFSEPFELNWCQLEKPELIDNDNPYNDITKHQDYYLFSEDNPGRITIDAKTVLWVNGKENKDDVVEWEISPNPNKMFTDEGFKNGREVKLRVEKLPENNKDFGNKKIKAKYEAEGCSCESEETEVKIFYLKDAKNNPDSKEPNWYYYWKQTKAWNNGYNVEFSEPLPLPIQFFGIKGNPIPNEGARYEWSVDKIYVSQLATGFTYSPLGDKPRTGIDCYATCLRHEEQHRTDLTTWWGKLLVNYNLLEDCDMDLVPNKVEESLPGCITGCNLTTKSLWDSQHSCSGVPLSLKSDAKDIEVNAYQTGCKWIVGTADKEDWSVPGKQCDPTSP